ncbi:MAG: hypothetical protein H2069_03925 [Legionella sp.]|nr:hypothetical protein [Legionella sp.]
MIIQTNRQEGVILISSLLILTVLASLLLTNMQSSLLSRRALNQWMHKTHTLAAIEGKAIHILSTPIKKGCFTEALSPNAIMTVLQQKQACALISGNETYYYIFENIGLFPCITLPCGTKTCGTFHRRLSVFNPKNDAFLQIRLAEPVAHSSCEAQVHRPIKGRVLNWRYLKLEHQEQNN